MEKEKGQSFIEFAVILPMLFIFLLVAFDLGKWVNIHYMLQELASEINRIYVMREEHTEQSMLKNQRSFQNVDETIEKMIKHNTVLDSERISYHIAMSDPYERHFDRKEYRKVKDYQLVKKKCRKYDPYYGWIVWDCDEYIPYVYDELYTVDNYNRIANLKVEVSYRVSKSDFIFIDFSSLKETISKSYSGIVFLGSDAHD